MEYENHKGVSECGPPKFMIPKDVLENLVDEDFAISKIAKLLSVSESTIFRRMRQYSIFKNIFSTCNDDELDASVGPLIKDYPFCGENILGQMLRKTGIKVNKDGDYERVCIILTCLG